MPLYVYMIGANIGVYALWHLGAVDKVYVNNNLRDSCILTLLLIQNL